MYAPEYLRALYPGDDGVTIDVDDELMAESMSIETEYGCRFILRDAERRVVDRPGATRVRRARRGLGAAFDAGPQELPEALRRARMR